MGAGLFIGLILVILLETTVTSFVTVKNKVEED